MEQALSLMKKTSDHSADVFIIIDVVMHQKVGIVE